MAKKYTLDQALTMKPGPRMSEKELKERLYVATTGLNTRIKRLQEFEVKIGTNTFSQLPKEYNWHYEMTKQVDNKRVSKTYDELYEMYLNMVQFYNRKTSSVKGLKEVLLENAMNIGTLKKKDEKLKDTIRRSIEEGTFGVYLNKEEAINIAAKAYDLINKLKEKEYIDFTDLYSNVGWNGIVELAFGRSSAITNKPNVGLSDWIQYLEELEEYYKYVRGPEYNRRNWLDVDDINEVEF